MTVGNRVSAAVPRLIVVAGPTGTGKSELGIALAHRLDGEIISADSMQLYRGMDIGTAKVTGADQQGIPHHLLDVLEVTERASVAAYQRQARERIEDILDRGRTPILVGGSGLYLQAVIDEMDFPGTDETLRAALLVELRERGAAALHRRLQQQDPAAARAIGESNGRRIVRALEVIALTGRPFTATLPTPGPPRYDAVLIYLDRPTDQLDRRLADRVDEMMRAGLLAEVTGLLARGLRDGATASRAVGYRQLIRAIDGEVELPQAVTDIVTATRRFVRRQRSWFGRDDRWLRFDAGAPDLVDSVLRAVSGP